MHGPGWPAWEPTWTGRVIPVLDTVAATLRPRRRAKWQKARDTALAKWAPSGVTFHVTEQHPEGYPKLDPRRVAEPMYFDSLIVSGFLRLMRAYRAASHDGFAWWAKARDPGAIAFVKMGPAFWLRSSGQKSYVIGHEVGHCLGLSHRPAGSGSISAGIMGTGTNPDAHDLESVHAYYLP